MRPAFIRLSGGLFVVVGLISAFARAGESGSEVCELKRTESAVEFESSVLKINRDFYDGVMAKARPHAEVMARNLNQIFSSLSTEERDALHSSKREAVEYANQRFARMIQEDESHLRHFDCGADFSGKIETFEGKLYCNPRWHRHYLVPSFSTTKLLITDDGSYAISLSHKNDLLPSNDATAHFVVLTRDLGTMAPFDSEKIARTLLKLDRNLSQNVDVNEDSAPSLEVREPISRAEYIRDQLARRAPHCLHPDESHVVSATDPKSAAGYTDGTLPMFVDLVKQVLGTAAHQL